MWSKSLLHENIERYRDSLHGLQRSLKYTVPPHGALGREVLFYFTHRIRKANLKHRVIDF